MTAINDNITLGTYIFTVNPQQYSVNYIPFKSSKRSLNGKLQTAYVLDMLGKTVKKREISITGISEDQLNYILAEFDKAEDLFFTDIYNESFYVQFSDFNFDVDAESVQYPAYSIQLMEV